MTDDVACMCACVCVCVLTWHACMYAQAFINTARAIYNKIEQGVFDVSNEARAHLLLTWHDCLPCVHAHADGFARPLRLFWACFAVARADVWHQGWLRRGRPRGQRLRAPGRRSARSRKEQLLLSAPGETAGA